MRRRLERLFQNGILGPQSQMRDVPHIGPYLYDRLCRGFGVRQLTIATFARRLEGLSVERIRWRLERALQNERNNRCVPSVAQRRRLMYHVPDVNAKGYETLLALIRLLIARGDGHRMAGPALRRLNPRLLYAPARRPDVTRHFGCVDTSRRCARAGGVFADGLCQPPTGVRRGFPGVRPYAGQTATVQENRRRGAYAAPRNGQSWRRPGAVRKLPNRP